MVFQGDRFIAWMRCTRIGSVPNPSCNLNASPTEGTSWAQLGFYPAINAGRIAEQMPSIFRKLQFNLPQSRPDLRLLLQQTYLETRVVFSDAAMAQFLKFEEDLR